jgi:type IV secretion system protein VirB10
MSQNVPPNPPDRPQAQDDYDSNPSPRRSDAADSGLGANPYYTQQQGSPPPDLDANAPTLKSSELQRLNRKALVFLAGIVAVLVVAVFLMLRGASGKDEQTKPREETVVIPDLPDAPLANAPPAAPIEMAPAAPTELPPLPPPEPDYAGAYRDAPQEPSGPSLLERRMMMERSGESRGQSDPSDAYMKAMLASAQAGQGGAPAAADPMEAKPTSARFINKPGALLVRGTYIRCVLETRIITDVSGFTSCVVTEPIYSINGRSLLVPKGSKILGKYNSGLGGVQRVSVIWDRITTPNGMDINMASPGVDNLGGAGYEGQYDAHWGSRISSALLISLISDAFKYAAAEHGPETTTITGSGLAVQSPYESATARTMERLANQALDNRRPPTVTINQGTVVNVYVAKDVDFSGVLAKY